MGRNKRKFLDFLFYHQRPFCQSTNGDGSIFSFFVEIFKGMYRGQNPVVLVMRNIMARMPKIIAAMPVICSVKNKAATTIARIIRIMRSIAPMFPLIGNLLLSNDSLITYLV